MNHFQSLKFESKLYAMVKDKMEEMQQHMSWIEVTSSRKSLDIRRVPPGLMYTYVSHYLKKNNNGNFEDNQKRFGVCHRAAE